MLAALAAQASHPVVAGLLGIGAAGVAGGVVATAWSVQVHQIRLAAQLARRQLLVADGAAGPDDARVLAAAAAVNGTGDSSRVRHRDASGLGAAGNTSGAADADGLGCTAGAANGIGTATDRCDERHAALRISAVNGGAASRRRSRG